VFTTAHPRVATPHRGSAARNNHGTFKRIVATVTAFVLGGAFALAAPIAASAEDRPASYAEGQFLSGTLLGMDLDRVLALDSAEARNDGTQPTQTSKDPLDADVLEEYEIAPETSPQVDLGEVLQIGPVAQYAEANNDGSSFGASGAVADDGAIGVGTDQSTPPANATFDLEALLGAEFASTLVDLKLELGAIAASANGNLDVASGDYSLANAYLTFTSPAIADLTPKVNSALEEVQTALNKLVGTNGALIDDVNALLVGIDPLLNLVGGSANVSATIDTGNLQQLVSSILTEEYGDGAVSFDLETGEVRVDLAALLGGDLNNLPENTELLTDAIVNQILSGITGAVSTIADQVVAKVEDALHDATVDIHADLSVNVAQSPIVKEVCELVDRVVTTPVLGEVTLLDRINALANGLVGELTDSLLEVGDFVYDENGVVKQVVGFVNQTVQDTVCNPTSTSVLPLTTSVVLDVTATVDQLLNGVATNASADVEVLGIPASLSIGALLDDLGGSLLDGLFDGDGAIAELIATLNSTLVHPATEALLGSGDGTVGDALRDVLSVRVNIKETTLASAHGMAAMAGSMFTQTAVRVSVLGSSVATVNLAQATVGPNITSVVDCTDPDGCDTGGETVTPPGGGGPGGGSLAYTGIGIATLIAVILALLAAGAYLVRESYRRNHPVVTTIG
jgi:hypothetical protein